MHALLIEVNFTTGERAAGIDPRDEGLPCYQWQSTPERDGPDVELRLVADDRDLTPYRRAAGVRVLDGEQEIDAAIERFVPPKYVADEDALKSWMRREAIEYGSYKNQGLTGQERLRTIHEDGGPVQVVRPQKISEMRGKGTRPGWGDDLGSGNGLPSEVDE